MSTQQAMHSPPRRYLVHNEIEEMSSKSGDVYKFRVRIWRGRNAVPVVLVSQLPSGVQPDWMTIKMANYCYATLLKYPDLGMLYFEDDEFQVFGDRRVCRRAFEYFGCEHRSRLFRPSKRDVHWSFIEHAIGEKIDH